MRQGHFKKVGSGLKFIGISPATNTVVRAGRVFDGNTMLPEKNINIEISRGLIWKIGTEGKPGAVDLSEYTVLPGLIDCHVHLALDGRDFHRALDLWGQEVLLMERIREDLEKYLDRGIVALRDGGDSEWIGLSARNAVNRGSMPGPRVLASGIALGRKGKYGSFLGPGIKGEQIRDAVEKTASRGVDQIKVLVSGVVSFKNYRQVGELQFTPQELGDLVSAAHSLGLKVMAHASSDEAARMAVNAGVDSLEHGYFIAESTLEDMARRGTAWIPTLAPVVNQARGLCREKHSPEEIEVIERTYKQQMKMVKTASSLGVTLGIGTDAGATGVLHGDGFMDELLFMEESGLGRGKILQAATRNGASITGLAEEMGMIRPGLSPYLIAVRGNPLEDLSCIKDVEFMILPSGG